MGREMIESLGYEKYYKKYKPLRILGWKENGGQWPPFLFSLK
jgi:hypothetical protein